MDNKNVLLIVVDSGFDASSLHMVASRLLAYNDLVNRRVVVGSPVVSEADRAILADDPLNHGSIVLSKLARLVPDARFLLIRAINREDRIVRAERAANGAVVRDGYAEAIADAVRMADDANMYAVVNCSFGGYTDMTTLLHECNQIAPVVGAGKPGRIFVAATGAPERDYVAAPAIFPQVLSVGLRDVNFGSSAGQPGSKPDILLPGDGPISFRTPEVTAAVAHLLRNGCGNLDVNGMRALLGKYPDVGSLLGS